MSKKILIEEISRIHEMMGIKSNRVKNLLTEAIISPRLIEQNLYSSAFKQDLVDMAENTLKIVKKDGSSLTFDDLVKMGREIAGDAALSEAESILKILGRAGKTASEEISQRILATGFGNSRFALNAMVTAEADAAKKSAIKGFADEVEGITDEIVDGSKTLTDAIDDINTLTALVDADTTLEAATKQTLKDELQGILDDLNSTKTLRDEASAFETANPGGTVIGKQIGEDIVTTNPTNLRWEKIKVMLKSKFPEIDFDSQQAKDVQALFESGGISELEAETALYNYYKKLKEAADGGGDGKISQEDAQKRLLSLYETLAKIAGTTAETIATILKKFSKKKSALGGFINIASSLVILSLVDTAFDVKDDYWTDLPIRDCLDEIPGFDQYSDQAWWPSNDAKLRTLIVSEFMGDEKVVCGDETTGEGPQIKRVTFQELDKPPYEGQIAIVYSYVDGCTETFVVNKDWSKGTWKGPRCGGSTPPPPPPPNPPTGGKTLAEFQTYVNNKIAAHRGMTAENAREESGQYVVDIKMDGVPAGQVTKSKDGSDWN